MRDDAGTSVLELVGFVPVVGLVLLALVQGGVAVYGVAATQDAARNAARVSALGGDAAQAADRSVPGWMSTRTTVLAPGSVRVRVDVPDLVPGVDLAVTREAVLPAGVLP